MKAIQLLAYGRVSAGLGLREIDEPPPPGPGEALVQVHYAPINVNDLMIVKDKYPWKPVPPATLGNEGAGVVLAVGPDVEELAVGTRVVLPYMGRSWRERLVVRADALTPLPADANLQQASMAAINAVTAWMLLNDFVDLKPGDAIAYNAATSGLGHWLAGLAARRGLRSVGLVRRPGDAAKVHASGCELVLSDGEGADKVQAALGSARVRLALDGVGGESAGRLAGLLSDRGTLVAYGAASGKPMAVSAQHLIFKRLVVRGFFEGHPENESRVRQVLSGLTGLLGPGGIVQPVAAIYPPEEIASAAAHADSGSKVLLAFA